MTEQLMTTSEATASTSRTGSFIRDINSKRIFQDPLLCSQFLRDNLNLPALKNVQPEDIEDVSEHFHTYLGIEFEADSVKKIYLRKDNGERLDQPLYLLSLIEHKSRVDYDVSMQLLKYMVCIWDDCGKEAQKKAEQDGYKGAHVTKKKAFRYPLILPVVYFEGKAQWTAGLHLHNRIQMSDVYGDYLPNFQYLLVRNHDYSNEELLERGNAMALLMLINKIQNADDFHELTLLSPQILDEILEKTPLSSRKTISDTLRSLLIKMNVPEEEANECIDLVEKCHMGYLFENIEKMDIQEERKNTALAREALSVAREEISFKNQLLAEKDQVIAEKDSAIAEKDSAIAERDHAIAALKQELQRLKQNIE